MNAPHPQVPLAHRLMLGTSLGALFSTALVLWRALPQLPVQIPLHFNIADRSLRLGPASDLWILWWTIAGTWVLLLFLAQAVQKAGRLNGMPVPAAEDQPRVRLELRGMMLALQIIVMLIGCGLLIGNIIRGLGGPHLEALAILPVVAVPVTLGYFLYRMSIPFRPA
ncbi:hypothetical protein [Deinococcus altitudinis]|uniref:hypothetical protein n=1 Tax=Deinococcus altitudinis TaxID=468914 RepID=UPI003892A649